MKKSILITATLAALAMLSSCQKEQFTKNVTSATGVTEFTATIEQPTKTAINAEGKVTWVAGDTITVTDADQKSAVYVASSAGASTTFTLKEGQTAVGDGPYTATYGDIANQVYDEAGANCPLTAPGTSTTNFKFSSPYAVVKITAQSDGGETIESVEVNYGENTYTLDCGDSVTLTSGGIDFFVSVESATEAAALSVTFHTTDGKTATKSRTSDVALAAKDLLPVTLTFAAADWASPEADTPEGALKGVFSVSAGKQVQFSQGNLRYVVNGTKWEFYENQYGFCNTNTYDGHHADTVSLFTWGYDATKSIVPDGEAPDNVSRTSGNLQQTEDWGCKIGDGNIWRTLTKDEWTYLFNTRTASTVNGTENACYAKATVNNIIGIILLPDTYAHPEGVAALSSINTEDAAFTANTYDSTNWAKMESAGAVFLPAAGHRIGPSVSNVGVVGSYWSSTALNSGRASNMYFDAPDVHPGYDCYRDVGCSVRLVTDVSVTPTPTEPEYVEITALYNGTDSTTLKWYRQNLAITGSGNMKWKGNNPSAVKVPGTDEDVIVGDYFQWAASYEGYNVTENKKPDTLLLYSAFTNKYCVDGGADNKFTFKSDKLFDEANSPYYSDGFTKYTKTVYSDGDGRDVLEKTDDVASIILGDNWRMPTQAEFSAMKDATYWAWAGDDCGYYVFTPDASHAAGEIADSFPPDLDRSDALLFFPTSGFGNGTVLDNAGSDSKYWSGSLYSDDPDYAFTLYFDSNNVDLQSDGYRCYGFSIRPVSD